MALRDTPRRPWRGRLHFLIRFLGLTGFLAVVLGAGLALVQNLPAQALWPALTGETTDLVSRTAAYLVAIGGGAVLLALLVELLGGVRLVAGRRSLFGLNAAVQVVLAAALLVAVNVFSFQHYTRQDWTRDHKFSLPATVVEQLGRLEGKTTIVVYKQHRTFGGLSDTVDAYEAAAEDRVVEKVQDLVDQFRELGPQFQVVVLDVKDKEQQTGSTDTDDSGTEHCGMPVNDYHEKKTGFAETLAELPEELQKAIAAAPENSIFFHANGKVQRLSFNDLYRLDKEASRRCRNLVLEDQGVEPFARKVLNVDEKRPVVGIAVVHEWLTTEGPEEFGLAGLRKTLNSYGFDVRDIILKKWSEFAPPEPAVYTYAESKLGRLEEELAEEDANIKGLEDELKQIDDLQHDWKSSTLEELTKKYPRMLRNKPATEELRQAWLGVFKHNIELRRLALADERADRDKTLQEKAGLNVEDLAERRRMTDLKAKFERSLADCDLLIVPRMTLRDVTIGDRIPNRVYRLDQSQVDAIQDFMKSGRPVLACFGPINEPRDSFADTPGGPDKLEDLLGQLGIKFGKQTVLFNVESRAFAERRSGLQIGGSNVEVPPVSFAWEPEAVRPAGEEEGTREPNPIRESMLLTSRSVGKKLDLRLRHPRPVYFEPGKGQTSNLEAEFMMTDREAWNEEQPFPSREHTPRFEPPGPDDPTVGTRDEKRRGRFPIGVAVETTVPAAWYGDAKTKPATVRVAAIGHGGLFVGADLSPAREKLLLNTCNWLLGREDYLPREARTWEYPRVALSERDRELWHWGMQVGLPLVFAYLGVVVLLVRRLR